MMTRKICALAEITIAQVSPVLTPISATHHFKDFVLPVVRQCCIDGYRDFSLIRASSVVKRQSTRIASRLRCCCHAPTSRRRRFGPVCAGPGIAGPSPRFQSRPYPANCHAWECSESPTVRRCAALLFGLRPSRETIAVLGLGRPQTHSETVASDTLLFSFL